MKRFDDIAIENEAFMLLYITAKLLFNNITIYMITFAIDISDKRIAGNLVHYEF